MSIAGTALADGLTMRQLLQKLAGARGHLAIAGSPERIADVIEDWFRTGAADGFNVMPPVIYEHLELFTAEVVPILQKRALFRTEYTGYTLRDLFGLASASPSHPLSATGWNLLHGIQYWESSWADQCTGFELPRGASACRDYKRRNVCGVTGGYEP